MSVRNLRSQIWLVSNNHNQHVIVSIGLHLLQPELLYLLEGTGICYVIDNDDGLRIWIMDKVTSIICTGDGSEPLLSSSIPNLHFVPFLVNFDGFDFKVDSNSRHIGILKMILTEPGDQVCLSHSTVPNYNNFDHKVVFFIFICSFHLL